MTLLYEPDTAAAGALHASLPRDVHPVVDLGVARHALSSDSGETLLIVGPTVDLEDVLSFTERLRYERPASGVVLVRQSVDVDVLTHAIRAGVREVLAVGDTPALADACRRHEHLARQVRATTSAVDRDSAGKVVTVFSAKGGSGKTTLAINLALALNAGGERRVCLVDLDLAFGDVAISMQLEPKRTIATAAATGVQLDTAKVEAVVTSVSPGLDCVLAPVEPGAAEKVPAALVSSLLEVLVETYDYVVVDTPSQFSEHVLAALDASDQQVLLTAPELPALKNLRLTLDMLDLLGYPKDHRAVVFNRSDSKVGLTAADVARIVRHPIAAHVPSSRDVPVSINRGIPLIAERPDHPISQAIRRFVVECIVGDTTPAVRRSPLKLGRRAS